MSSLINNAEYINWLQSLKYQIKQSQIKATLSVNSQLIALYWHFGKEITEKQKNRKWGSGLIDQMAIDLKNEFPQINGFSRRNLYLMRQFYLFYFNETIFVHQLGGQTKISNKIVHPLGAQLKTDAAKWEQLVYKVPWKHNVLIIQKIKNLHEATFYLSQTIENNWSRAILEYQIETNLYKRQGKAISNFKQTLPKQDGDLAQQLLKDPYSFDFLTLSTKAKEKDLEQKLIDNITRFLLELGKGFAYMGRQFPLKVGEKEFRTDLLFYHTKLKAYVVIELKMKEFEPEFIGKLNFYITAINELIKNEDDKPTLGILLCKKKDNYVVDFSLKDVNKPIGVSGFTYTELPDDIKNAIPSEEEFQIQLKQLKDEGHQ